MNQLSQLLMHRACGLELMAYLVEELPAEEGKIHLKFGVFEVKTIRIRGKNNYGKLAL